MNCYALPPVHPPMSMFLCASGVLQGTCVSALVRGMHSLAFHCVRSCSCGCACFELALVNLCSQWSAVVHMRMDPMCLL